MESRKHISVLPDETMEFLIPSSGSLSRMIDGTLGCGGHSARVLERFPEAEVLGIDRDPAALTISSERLAFAGKRVHFAHGPFSKMRSFAAETGWTEADAILLDIGVSSPQIDNPERGFSWRGDGPLDMRMDPSAGRTAADLLREADLMTLTAIFRDYGGIAEAKRLASAVVERRRTAPFERCADFTALCDRVLQSGSRRSGPPAPTLPYQALRIAVNDELGELERGLKEALALLRPGGRLCVISFHSLEDRIVKRYFQDMAVTCKCPPGCPVCICGWTPKLKILTKKPVEAADAEKSSNPRSGCARLRAAEKIG